MAKWKKGDAWLLPYTNRAYRPYAQALGELALAWNGLHEDLCMLFCSIMGGGPVNQFIAVWHALQNDRAQRELLKAAAKAHFFGAIPVAKGRTDPIDEDIDWLCKRADEVENARNDALHAPLAAIRQPGKVQSSVHPRAGLGHQRAEKLLTMRPNLLADFRWCRDTAITLSLFANAIDNTFRDPMNPWPDRPPLRRRPEVKRSRPSSQAPKTKRRSQALPSPK